MEIGNLVRKVGKHKKGHSVLLFEGVIVNKRPLLWGRKITVQVVTPTPLFDRGEFTDENEEALQVIDKITI